MNEKPIRFTRPKFGLIWLFVLLTVAAVTAWFWNPIAPVPQSSRENLPKIEVGMPLEEVQALVGLPDAVIDRQGPLRFNHSYRMADGTEWMLFYVDGRVMVARHLTEFPIR
jgi:hypothetical protein